VERGCGLKRLQNAIVILQSYWLLVVSFGVANSADDYFLQSHGIKTPDAYWKVIVRGTGADERAIAWIVPNTQDATGKRLDQYLVSVEDIEKVTGEKIPVADYAKHDKLNAYWQIPVGYNEG
jgi:endonuclease G